MSASFSSVTPIAPAPEPEGAYVAGACNIGPWEIRRRRRSAVAAAAAAVVLFGILAVAGAPAWTRLVLILPFWGAGIAWLQARRRFCVAFAMAGVSNFGNGDAGRQVVVDPAQRALDRRATAVLVRDAFLLAIVPTVIAVLLPI
jgi:hypothetical protein